MHGVQSTGQEEIPAAARGIGQEADWEAGWVLFCMQVILAYGIGIWYYRCPEWKNRRRS